MRWENSSPNKIKGEQVKMAKWAEVSYLYEYDCKAYHRRLPKITDEHIKPNQLKMKISVATQVFSETYGKAMIDCYQKNQLPYDFNGTAQILLFFNDLFDSINGSNHPKNGTLKGSVNKDSSHFVFWEYAIDMLSKMDFINITNGNVDNASTVLKKFEATIRGYAELTRICFRANITHVSIRYSCNHKKLYFELIATRWF